MWKYLRDGNIRHYDSENTSDLSICLMGERWCIVWWRCIVCCWRRFSQGRSTSEQRRTSLEQSTQPDRNFRDSNNSRGGCQLRGSSRHDIFTPLQKRDDFDRGDGNGHNKGDKGAQSCISCGGPIMQCHCRHFKQANTDDWYTDHDPSQQPNQCRSQDARASETIYAACLDLPVSAPLGLGKGFVGNRIVRNLFYSGANILAVDRRLVSKSAYTGKYIHCRTFCGRVESFPRCRLFFRTPYYIGLADLCSLRKSISQLIVEQLKCVRKCTKRK